MVASINPFHEDLFQHVVRIQVDVVFRIRALFDSAVNPFGDPDPILVDGPAGAAGRFSIGGVTVELVSDSMNEGVLERIWRVTSGDQVSFSYAPYPLIEVGGDPPEPPEEGSGGMFVEIGAEFGNFEGGFGKAWSYWNQYGGAFARASFDGANIVDRFAVDGSNDDGWIESPF